MIATTLSSSGEILETQIIQVKREKERVGGQQRRSQSQNSMGHYTDTGRITLYTLYIRTLHTLLNDEPSNVQSTVQ